MIGYLKGNVLEVGAETAILEIHGVGYEVSCPGPVLQDLALHRDQPQELWIYTHLREDALHLFGFGSANEKEFFLTLLKINGVGPKMALSILSGASIEKIMAMIEAEDVKGLTQLPKVGKKTAEQMILSLKGKLVLTPRGASAQAAPVASQNLQMISSALVNLGYKINDVERVLTEFPRDMEVHEGVRRGLQVLAKPL
jgi:Holliday junction DNA helicase RuvA